MQATRETVILGAIDSLVMDEAHYIAGWKTANDWKALRAKLVQGEQLWKQAYEEYFLARLQLRYLDPIGVLQRELHYQGEGFSIAAIQCTLIEFLESTFRGLTYRYLKRGESKNDLGPYEYSSSSIIFIEFLCSHAPFSTHFNKESAEEFYRDVRCGLLHEAQTKGGWRIWAQSPDGRVVDSSNRIVYRDDMQAALLTFVGEYGRDLQSNSERQSAFVRKFDSLSSLLRN